MGEAEAAEGRPDQEGQKQSRDSRKRGGVVHVDFAVPRRVKQSRDSRKPVGFSPTVGAFPTDIEAIKR